MPIYTFKCKCGNKVDILVDVSDRDLRVCDKCHCGMKRNSNKKKEDKTNK